MKGFTVILCIALAHGAFAQRSFWNSLSNAGYANAGVVASLADNVGSGLNKGIGLAQGAVNAGTSVGRFGVNAATGAMGGVVNANLGVAGAINDRFMPGGVQEPVSHLLSAAGELEKAKVSGIRNTAGGIFNGIDGLVGAGAAVSSFGVNTATGAVIGGTNLMADGFNVFTGTMGALTNLASLPLSIMAQVKPMAAQMMKNMPIVTMRLLNKLKSENVFDYIKEKMEEIKHKLQEIASTYKEILKELTENISGADLRQLGEELVGNMTELMKGSETAIDNILTTIESKVPTLANYDSEMRAVLERVQKRFAELGEIGQELAENLSKAKETYDEIKAKITDEKLGELIKDLKGDFINLLKGNSSAIDSIVSKIETNYPELAGYESNIRSGLQAVQKVAQDISSFVPIFGDIMGKVSEIASYPETQVFMSQASRNVQSITQTPGFSNLIRSIPSVL